MGFFIYIDHFLLFVTFDIEIENRCIIFLCIRFSLPYLTLTIISRDQTNYKIMEQPKIYYIINFACSV